MLDFLKILNMGFCCTIIGKFLVENRKDLPNRFRPAHAGRTDGRTDEGNLIAPEIFYRKLPGGKKLKIPLLTGESRKRTLANQKTAVNRPI